MSTQADLSLESYGGTSPSSTDFELEDATDETTVHFGLEEYDDVEQDDIQFELGDDPGISGSAVAGADAGSTLTRERSFGSTATADASATSPLQVVSEFELPGGTATASADASARTAGSVFLSATASASATMFGYTDEHHLIRGTATATATADSPHLTRTTSITGGKATATADASSSLTRQTTIDGGTATASASGSAIAVTGLNLSGSASASAVVSSPLSFDKFLAGSIEASADAESIIVLDHPQKNVTVQHRIFDTEKEKVDYVPTRDYLNNVSISTTSADED